MVSWTIYSPSSGGWNSIMTISTHAPVNLNVTTVPLGAVKLFGMNWKTPPGDAAVAPTSTVYIFFNV